MTVTHSTCSTSSANGIYSETSLIRTPKGQNQVSALQRCPYYRGRECRIFGISRGVSKGRLDCTSLPIKLVYLFSKFSYWRFHWCFLDVVDLHARDLYLCLVVLLLIVEDYVKLQHYVLDIIGNFHFRFIDCNDWTIIFFQFKFSLTILCTIRQSVVTM